MDSSQPGNPTGTTRPTPRPARPRPVPKPVRRLRPEAKPAPVRVMHFSDTNLPRRDGIVTSTRTLLGSLVDQGHQSVLVVPHHPSQGSERGVLTLDSVPCGVAALRLVLPRAAHVDQLAGWAPDVVHVHTPGPAGLLGIMTARRLGVPVVHTYHTDLHAYAEAYRAPSAALRLMLRMYARRLDRPVPKVGRGRNAKRALIDAVNELLLEDAGAVVVPTPAILERTTLSVPEDRMFVAPAAVSRPSLDADAAADFRRRWSIPERAPVVLFVGRVNREKGVDLLVPAFERVAAELPDARLVLVGAVYQKRELRRMLKRHGIADRTHVLGEQPADEVAAAYAACDVFAFPSQSDTQGLVLQEAALAGRPAVLVDPALHTSNAVANAFELTEPSPDAFADRTVDLLRAPERSAAIGARARERAAAHTTASYASTMVDIYRHVLAD